MNKKKSFIWFLLAIWVLLVPGCFLFPDDPNYPTPDDPALTLNQHIYRLFQEWYLWDQELPRVDPDTFQSAEELVDALRYKTLDRWSYVTSLMELQKLLTSSEYVGYGVGIMFDTDRVLKVSRVYNDSPFGRAGVARGWRIVSVNGIEGSDYVAVNQSISSTSSATFELIDLEGEPHSLHLSKTSVKINTVLYSEIIELGNKKIGYLVFDSFYQNSINELKDEFTRFSNEKVTDLIIDLRYNSGGIVSVSHYLIGLLGGNQMKGKIITQMVHNEIKKEMNKSFTLNEIGPSANTSGVCFITTQQTASASEMTINALAPYMNVSQVGSPTHGKPVGMYIFEVKEYDLAIVPISFINLNVLGKGSYFNGLPVNVFVSDDLNHPWGHRDEGMLKASLNHVAGVVAGLPHYEKSTAGPIVPDYKGINRVINAY